MCLIVEEEEEVNY